MICYGSKLCTINLNQLRKKEKEMMFTEGFFLFVLSEEPEKRILGIYPLHGFLDAHAWCWNLSLSPKSEHVVALYSSQTQGYWISNNVDLPELRDVIGSNTEVIFDPNKLEDIPQATLIMWVNKMVGMPFFGVLLDHFAKVVT